MFRQLFANRGKKLRVSHKNVLMKYQCLIGLPIFIVLGMFHYYYTYPLIKGFEGKWSMVSLIFPVMVTILGVLFAIVISSYIIHSFILKGGFFMRQQKIELLAEYLYDNDFVMRKKVNDGKETCKFPPVYYKETQDVDEFTFRIGNKFHDKFLSIGKSLEEIYMADLMETERTPQHVTYKLLTDTISKRLNFTDVTVKDGVIKLMSGVEWDFDELPHMLITGGTGGGKTYFIYTLIAVLGKIGRVHVADPKKSDLSDLGDFPAFEGLVFSEKDDIFSMLKKSVDLMDQRFKYMKDHPKHKMGKNYRYYDMAPEFFVIDEWGAFVSTLSMKEEIELYQMISPLVLKARQAGVFLIIATQKAGTDVIKSMIRDNLMCKVSLGKLSATGYEITFGAESKNKLFYNKPKVKGRGYIDVGNGDPQELYAPFVEKDFSFEDYFSQMEPMPCTDVSHVELEVREAQQGSLKKDFFDDFPGETKENKERKKSERKKLFSAMEEEDKQMFEKR